MLTANAAPPLLERVVALTNATYAEHLVREHLERRDLPVVGVVPVGVRPKGAAGGLVTYSVELGDGTCTYAGARVATDRRLRAGWARLESERTKWRGKLAPGALVEDPGVLLTSFPLDRRLPWLRPYTEGEKAKSLLMEAGFVDPTSDVSKKQSRVAVASYRAERRAVLRWDMSARPPGEKRRITSVYIRLHSDPSPAVRSAIALSAAYAAGLPVPAPLAVDTDRAIAVEEAVGGVAARSGVSSADDAYALGEVTAQLHQLPAPSGLPISRRQHRIRQAARAVQGLAVVAPDLGIKAAELLAQLGSAAESATRRESVQLLHGDLHGGQLVVGEVERSLVDFDRACSGHPAQDIASFLAHSILERPMEAVKEFRAFAEGYTSRGPWLSTHMLQGSVAAELLCLADAPFRRLMSDWRDATGRLLDQADLSLARMGLK